MTATCLPFPVSCSPPISRVNKRWNSRAKKERAGGRGVRYSNKQFEQKYTSSPTPLLQREISDRNYRFPTARLLTRISTTRPAVHYRHLGTVVIHNFVYPIYNSPILCFFTISMTTTTPFYSLSIPRAKASSDTGQYCPRREGHRPEYEVR